MNKTTKQLMALLVIVLKDHLKGLIDAEHLGLHENGDGVSISIDLYHFGGSGRHVCHGLNFRTVCKEQPRIAFPFSMVFNPGRKDAPLVFLSEWVDNPREDKFELTPDIVPEDVQQRIVNWLSATLGIKTN